MTEQESHFDVLDRLRRRFLEGGAARGDYWHTEADLAAYDQTFGQRIGWKWDHVLADLSRLGWSPPPGEVLDWGCGSGIAGRTFLGRFGTRGVTRLVLSDRSRRAMDFAAARVREKFPGLAVEVAGATQHGHATARGRATPRPTQESPGAAPCTLLVSHVLTELSPRQADELADLANRATAVVWVEPGTFDASRALIAMRERLRGTFRVVAPCTHQAACGMLGAGRERHWCHHFAASPPEAFTDGRWARWAREMGIDLRSLPLSYLVLDRRPPAALPPGAVRLIGRPRVQKGWALLCGCDETAVHERRLLKRTFPREFRDARRECLDSLQTWECDGDRITRIEPLRAQNCPGAPRPT
jgi:hypothetical protein